MADTARTRFKSRPRSRPAATAVVEKLEDWDRGVKWREGARYGGGNSARGRPPYLAKRATAGRCMVLELTTAGEMQDERRCFFSGSTDGHVHTIPVTLCYNARYSEVLFDARHCNASELSLVLSGRIDSYVLPIQQEHLIRDTLRLLVFPITSARLITQSICSTSRRSSAA